MELEKKVLKLIKVENEDEKIEVNQSKVHIDKEDEANGLGFEVIGGDN